MSLATKTLKKQKRSYLGLALRGLALLAIGAYGGIMILNNGIGNPPSNENSKGAVLYNMLSDLMEKGELAQKLVPIGFAGFFFIIGAIGLYHMIRGMWQMGSKHTVLGKSILTQLRSNESFSETISSINADMEQEPQSFGNIHIGRKWILDIEAMRIEGIRGAFYFDAGAEDYVMCCVDDKQNIWASSSPRKDDRNNAFRYLRKTLPEIATGNKKAYQDFLMKAMNIEPELEPEPEVPTIKNTSLPHNATFSFSNAGGIPTSNFEYEYVLEELLNLDEERVIALELLTPADSGVSEILFRRAGDQWEVCVRYQSYNENYFAMHMVDESGACNILENLLKYKRLPEISAWKIGVMK